VALGTLAQRRNWLRVRLGHRDDTVLLGADDTDYSLVDMALDEAMGAINQYFPIVGVGNFNTVIDQQAYEPLPAGSWSIRKVFYGSPDTDCNVNFLPNADEDDLFEELVQEGTWRSIDPAVVTSFYRNRSALEAYATGGYEVIESEVYLDPVPTEVRAVYFLYSGPRFENVVDVTDNYEQSFRSFALYAAHSALAGGQGAVTSVGSDTGLRITTRASQHHLEQAKREYDRFISTLPPLSPVRNWVG